MRTVVVTGASQGLGQYVAKHFLAAGWRVVGTGRSERPAELDQAIDYRQFDASDAKACAEFWQQLQTGDGEVCLVNNAGGWVEGGILEVQPADYDTQMKSSYFSGVYMTQGLMKHVDKARVVNIISTSALAPHANDSAYGAAKAAAKHFFQSIQQEFAPEKYQITNLYPSDIASHGANPNAITADDLAELIVDTAQSQTSYYATDLTLRPVKRSN